MVRTIRMQDCLGASETERPAKHIRNTHKYSEVVQIPRSTFTSQISVLSTPYSLKTGSLLKF